MLGSFSPTQPGFSKILGSTVGLSWMVVNWTLLEFWPPCLLSRWNGRLNPLRFSEWEKAVSPSTRRSGPWSCKSIANNLSAG